MRPRPLLEHRALNSGRASPKQTAKDTSNSVSVGAVAATKRDPNRPVSHAACAPHTAHSCCLYSHPCRGTSRQVYRSGRERCPRPPIYSVQAHFRSLACAVHPGQSRSRTLRGRNSHANHHAHPAVKERYSHPAAERVGEREVVDVVRPVQALQDKGVERRDSCSWRGLNVPSCRRRVRHQGHLGETCTCPYPARQWLGWLGSCDGCASGG